ncbi:hypothetical protein [Vibrio antiquarius]|uniref:hypothetical protein n=1 Tax=Vibrio antiquarius (strain Ex25) TaxID=150340 RepID=UPI00265D5A38|nr:hypothetical protein [Vibrio antiquarius]MCS0045259.1 hypothetical protein [Vibrio antiquarius]
MKTVIGLSNFSFESQKFGSFRQIQEQLDKLKALQGKFNQHGVSLAIASDILKDKYFGQSLNTQFNNFLFGSDKLIVGSFKARLERGYFSGFDRTYTGEELKALALLPDEVKRICCTLYAPKVLISGSSNFKSIEDFSSYYEEILGQYPVDEDSYFRRAVSHFTNLIYHVDARSTMDKVDEGFCNYSISFTICLKALNDFSPTGISSTRDKVKTLRSMTPYDCTPENGSHKHFQFDFSYGGKEYKDLDCQYHMKPSGMNMKGDDSFHQKRLYFGFIPTSTTTWKVAVAAIGPHINNGSGERYAKPKVRRKKTKRKGNS